jgi:hypothetical protein
MANSDKNILITPATNTSGDPRIVYTPNTAANVITQRLTDSGTLSFEGSAGQLFSITNSLTGTLFSVNDVSGIPSIDVADTGIVRISPYNGVLAIGSLAPIQVSSVNSEVSITGSAANQVPLAIRGAASQSADLLQVQNSGGTIVANVTSSGALRTTQGVITGAIQGSSDGLTAIVLAGGRSVQLGSATASLGGGAAVIGIANATTVPTSNPTGGGVLFVETGALKYRGTSGSAATIVTADGIGLQGAQGTQGVQGTTGTQGVQGTIGLQGIAGTSPNTFTTIATPSGTNPVADLSTDTLTYTAAGGLTITGDATTDTVAFSTNATSANSSSTIVARDASGNFTANVITATTVSAIFSGNGASITSLNGDNISSGTVADARIASTIARNNVGQTFSGTQTFSSSIDTPGIARTGANSLALSTANQTGSAGSISITAGNSTSNGSGGNITLTAGNYVASGASGNVTINAGGGTGNGSINIGTAIGSSQPVNIGNSGSLVTLAGDLLLGTTDNTSTGLSMVSGSAFEFSGSSTTAGQTTLTNVPGTVNFATSKPSMVVSVLTANAATNTTRVGAEFRATGTTTTHLITFSSGTTARGSISTNSTTTTYSTSSDYRLKENVEPITGATERLMLLKPSRFNFIEFPERVVDGFIAHEAQEVVPESVTGTKDELNEDGSPAYQGIDQGKLVPLLTAALQEAIIKIEELNTRLSQLEQ